MYRTYKNVDGLEILLPESVFGKIKQHVGKYYPNECGGIFVGKIILDEQKAIVEKIMMPKRLKSTPVYFLRLSRFINQWLLRLFRQSGGESFYLGEWHSHPNGRPRPSHTDYETMKRISENPNVRIQTPLLLIVGYDRNIYDEIFYLFTNNNLIPYDKNP
jgi:integrative and conjugative element protein (TIGR02256 family)